MLVSREPHRPGVSEALAGNMLHGVDYQNDITTHTHTSSSPNEGNHRTPPPKGNPCLDPGRAVLDPLLLLARPVLSEPRLAALSTQSSENESPDRLIQPQAVYIGAAPSSATLGFLEGRAQRWIMRLAFFINTVFGMHWSLEIRARPRVCYLR